MMIKVHSCTQMNLLFIILNYFANDEEYLQHYIQQMKKQEENQRNVRCSLARVCLFVRLSSLYLCFRNICRFLNSPPPGFYSLMDPEKLISFVRLRRLRSSFD